MLEFVFPDIPSVRLDHALALKLNLGLRVRQDYVRQGLVLVDGRPGRKGDMIRPGQVITVRDRQPQSVTRATDLAGRIVARSAAFAAIHKPGGMHSVTGKGEPALESRLGELGLDGWTLLNRLDFLTSGLVLAAKGLEAASIYARWQDDGLVEKYYLAVGHGTISAPLELRGRICDDRRRVVRVTSEEDAPLRATHVTPLEMLDECTVLLVRIRKGRRHQIRAHLAQAGHPLVGDPLYGHGEGDRLFLHHAQFVMPDFHARVLPEWPVAVSVLERAVQALEERLHKARP